MLPLLILDVRGAPINVVAKRSVHPRGRKTDVPLVVVGSMGHAEDFRSTFRVQWGRLSREGMMALNQGQCSCMEDEHTGRDEADRQECDQRGRGSWVYFQEDSGLPRDWLDT